MNATITVRTQSGADVEISQDRHEVSTYGSSDFDRRLIAETLDAVVERVRASYGIPTPEPDEPTAADVALWAAEPTAADVGNDNEMKGNGA